VDIKSNLKIVNSKLSEIRKKMKLKKYYVEKLDEGKTYIATIIDKIIFRVIIVLIVFFMLLVNSNSTLFSILITSQLYMIYHFIAYKINKNRMKKRINKINKIVVEEKIFKDLINKPPYEFISYIEEILRKCGFKNIQLLNSKDIDMIASIARRKVGIKCYQYNTDYKVSINNIRDFFLELRRLKIEEGIIITTSTFSKDIDSFLPKLSNYVDIKLFDIVDITKLMKKAELYPSEGEIKRIILSEISESRPRLVNYKETVLSKNKILKYFLIGAILNLFSRITLYQTYYKVASYILISIGIITLIGNVLTSRNEVQEDKNIL